MFKPYQVLVDIENGLGLYSGIGISKSVRRDAGNLYDAIRKGDISTITKIMEKYSRVEAKCDMTGGPKSIKLPSMEKRNIATCASSAYVQFKKAQE